MHLRQKKSATVACKKNESDDDNLRKAFIEKQVELSQLTDAIGLILKGREVSQWRNDLDALKERNQLLVQAADRIGRINTTRKSLEELSENLKTVQAGRDQILDDIKVTIGRKTNLERDIENTETQVALLSRIRDLEEDRTRLEDDKPCPLCGATDHPYARGNVPELNKAETTLKKLKAELKTESEKLSKLEAGRAKKDADIQNCEKHIAEKRATLTADEKQSFEALTVLNIAAELAEHTEIIQSELTHIQALIVETSGIVATSEDRTKIEKSSRTDLEKMRCYGRSFR